MSTGVPGPKRPVSHSLRCLGGVRAEPLPHTSTSRQPGGKFSEAGHESDLAGRANQGRREFFMSTNGTEHNYAEGHMGLREALLPEFDDEMANTRKSLERVPEDKLRWKPHDKSMTMGELAVHLATIPGWAVQTIGQDALDMAPPGEPPYQPPSADSRTRILAIFDQSVEAARAAIAGVKDEHLARPWMLLSGGKTVFTLPRSTVLRSMIMNHSIHHRAQLGVYLRLNDIPVPAIYGPSADEAGM
jgi:uncharacterized damage-inducible protein DinB